MVLCCINQEGSDKQLLEIVFGYIKLWRKEQLQRRTK